MAHFSLFLPSNNGNCKKAPGGVITLPLAERDNHAQGVASSAENFGCYMAQVYPYISSPSRILTGLKF